jgi:Tol biopolymer transport system component
VFDPWSPPVNLGDVVNSTSNDTVPVLSSDDETMFFASDRPGGFGLSDIYMTTRTKRHSR